MPKGQIKNPGQEDPGQGIFLYTPPSGKDPLGVISFDWEAVQANSIAVG